MVELKEVPTFKLVAELEGIEGVKSTYVTEEEFSKILVSKSGQENFRYIKGFGPLKILEIKLWK